MAKYTYRLLACISIYIWLLFYANDGHVRYVPKRLRLSNRLKSYLAYLKAWMKDRWHNFMRNIKFWKATNKLRRQSKENSYQLHQVLLPMLVDPEGAYNWILVQEAILAQQATSRQRQKSIPFDTDSKELGIDNRASAFISGDTNDFKHLQPSNRVVSAFGGNRINKIKKGTAIIHLKMTMVWFIHLNSQTHTTYLE